MNEGTFEPYIPGWYEVQFSEKDDFRNEGKSEADLNKYGTYWAVKFQGDAETFYWSKREQPVDGQKYYGHIEPSKSGKSLNFKLEKDQPPENVPKAAASNYETVDKQESIIRQSALKSAVALVAPNLREGIDRSGTALMVADKFLAWLKNEDATTDPPGNYKVAETADSIKNSKLRSQADKAYDSLIESQNKTYPVNPTDEEFLDLVSRGQE